MRRRRRRGNEEEEELMKVIRISVTWLMTLGGGGGLGKIDHVY